MAYKLFTDSSADLPLDIIEKYNITVVPLSVSFGEEEFMNLTPKEFYEKLEASDTLPTTSQIPPERFIDAFKGVINNGDKVICVTIGSNASGTFQSACIAKETLNIDDILLIDSNSLCLGTGMIVVKIAKMLEEQAPIESIMEMVNFYANNKIEHLFCVDTMKYLKKGGRVKAPKAAIAEVLNIKPILTVEDAITVPFGKVRGRNKVISYYVDHIKGNIDREKTEFIMVGHSQDRAFADKMVEALRSEVGFQQDIIVSEIGAIIGTHAGPGVLAVFYIKR